MSIFKLKQFDLKQSDSLQKMGSDTMLLGASIVGNYKNILDIGTGTGILALMMAQRNSKAKVFAIEPHYLSFEEAKYNFKNSKFTERLYVENSKLQVYIAQNNFDLIISNPPYYENSTLGEKVERNTARHTIDLSISDFYFNSSKLLSLDGTLALIFPYDLIKTHINKAKQNGLFPHKILTIVKDNTKPIRAIINYKKTQPNFIEEDSIIITQSNGKYSNEYIRLTKDFYAHDLASK